MNTMVINKPDEIDIEDYKAQIRKELMRNLRDETFAQLENANKRMCKTITIQKAQIYSLTRELEKLQNYKKQSLKQRNKEQYRKKKQKI